VSGATIKRPESANNAHAVVVAGYVSGAGLITARDACRMSWRLVRQLARFSRRAEDESNRFP